MKYLSVKEVVGPVHSAQDPLETPQPHKNALEKIKTNADTDLRNTKSASQTHTKYEFELNIELELD